MVGIAYPSDERADDGGVVLAPPRSGLWVAGLSLTIVIGDEAVSIGLATGPRARAVFSGCPSPKTLQTRAALASRLPYASVRHNVP